MPMDEVLPVRIIIIEAQSESVIGEVLRELGSAERMRGVFVSKMENTYNVSGQAGAVGPNATAINNSFTQSAPEMLSDANLVLLAAQLDIVRNAMKVRNEASSSAEMDEEIGQVARAQIAAEKGNRSDAIAHLKKVGNWTLFVAKEVSAEIVALTIAHLLEY